MGEEKHNGFCHLSKTERKGETGRQMCQQRLPGPGVGHLTDVAELGTPGTITGIWGPHFCGGSVVGDVDGHSGGVLVVTLQRWKPTMLVTVDGHLVSIFPSRYTMRGPVQRTSQEK